MFKTFIFIALCVTVAYAGKTKFSLLRAAFASAFNDGADLSCVGCQAILSTTCTSFNPTSSQDGLNFWEKILTTIDASCEAGAKAQNTTIYGCKDVHNHLCDILDEGLDELPMLCHEEFGDDDESCGIVDECARHKVLARFRSVAANKSQQSFALSCDWMQ